MNMLAPLKGPVRRTGQFSPKYVPKRVSQTSLEKTKAARSWGVIFLLLGLGCAFLHESDTELKPNWELLNKEVFSQQPDDIITQIKENKGAGVAIYVVDSGELEPEIASKVKESAMDILNSSHPLSGYARDHGSIKAHRPRIKLGT